ncbi:hypothetical protein [Brevibacterium aurantiacum]|uniref:Glycerophosphoryl diester phosphodiesterase n=1 Tax=Brevibacterium aurantiacum TaxID=273384 RepID=A0A1D7W6V7_BREAU|nr:hypothetical protein [Brevibacterium aurantiacum]AOP54797.1 Glycerophosphoryl diester phosphodiesterase [Brevibacterium aurantiacum]
MGPSFKLPNQDLRTLINAGLKVVPYTMPTAGDGHRLPHGVAGFFTNDAWTN